MACSRQIEAQFLRTLGSYQKLRLPTTQHLHTLFHNNGDRQILTIVVSKPFESALLFYATLSLSWLPSSQQRGPMAEPKKVDFELKSLSLICGQRLKGLCVKHNFLFPQQKRKEKMHRRSWQNAAS